MSALRLLLSNVLYRGDIAHKGVIYPGEHPALVARELWQEANAKHNLSRVETRSHRKLDTPIGGLLRCGHCSALLTTSFTHRGGGTRHVYYACRAGKRQQPVCPQQPLSASDLEQALRERLQSGGTSTAFSFEQLVRAVTYHSGTRQVRAELRDESCFEFAVPVLIRGGVQRGDCNRKCVNGRAKTDQSESTKSDLSLSPKIVSN